MKNTPSVVVAVVAIFAAIFAAIFVAGCGGEVADCQKIAEEQASCMPDSAIENCEQENLECQDGGEVLVLESCPLQFSCDPPGNG